MTRRRHRYASPGGWPVLLGILFLAGAAYADDPTDNAPVLPDTTVAPAVFGPGERMEFSIDYGLINAGDASLEVVGLKTYQGRRVYHIESKANSNRFFSAFYKVRDKIVSYMDVERMQSLYFHKRLREGDYRKTVEISFDHENGKARYADGRSFDTMPGTQDVLSAFYYVRNLDLAPGKVYSVPAHSSRRTYDLRVIVHRRERVEIDAGTWDCFVVEPVIEGEGLFKHEGKITLFITDDARRIPVLIRTKVPVGSIDVQLTKYRPGRSLRPLPTREPSGEHD